MDWQALTRRADVAVRAVAGGRLQEADLEDCRQDVLVRLLELEGAGRLDEQRVSGLIVEVAREKATKKIKQVGAVASEELADADGLENVMVAELEAPTALMLEEALGKMPPQPARVFRLYWQGIQGRGFAPRHAEIAATLGITSQASRDALRDARRHLRAYFGERG